MAKNKEYIAFTETGTSASGKTKTYGVANLEHEAFLGTIRWYSPWRRYVFEPEHNTVFDAKCLTVIKNKLVSLMEERAKRSYGNKE